jgi:transposase
MRHDMAVLTAGIDWATDTNELCIVDDNGQPVLRLNTATDAAGIRRLVTELERHSVEQVAIERPDGPVVDALLRAGLQVIMIPPRQVKHLRARYQTAGNKDDRFDAYVLADVLRTDAHRLLPLQPDSPQTVALRSTVRARTDLVQARVALCNQLRAHLRIVLPAILGLFADLDSPISLAFLTRFPSADKVAGLPTAASAPGWPPTPTAAKCPQRRCSTGCTTATTLAYVTALKTIHAQIVTLDAAIREQLAAHPDAAIFQSLPRSGTVRAAKLLVEIGDARGRFPTDASLAALAGAAPSTRQSGRHQVVTFRWPATKSSAMAVIDFAADSRRASPWAAAIYDRHRAAGKTHQHATRILARAWLRVIWRCWQDRTPYDPAQHGGAQRFLDPAT